MSVIKKPDLKIFAQDAKTGEVETFPDILRGWGVTLDRTAGKPPLEWFNAIGKRVDEWLMYLTQRGVAEWDTALSYPKTAIVQFNSVVYVSIKETKGEQPDKSQASWSTLGVFLGLDKYSTTAEMNLALLKKIDKANITHQTGNSTELVVSQQLLTTETGKKASTEALNLKFDKTGGSLTGYLAAQKEVSSNFNGSLLSLITSDESRGPHIAVRRGTNGTITRHNMPTVGGALMQVGDYGWGGIGDITTLNEEGIASYFKASSNVSRVFRNDADSTLYHYKYSTIAYFKSGDTYSAFSVDYSGKGAIAIGGNSKNFYVYNLLHDRNTKTDRNGNLKALNYPDELSDYPVGSPIPWPQSTAPTGYLICNGQSFNKTNYPLLALAYPSGNLPDLRGEFIRGLSTGRDVDAGRSVLSAQGDAIRNITGEFSNNGNARDSAADSNPTGAFKITKRNITSNLERNSDGIRYALDASLVVPTANENRPRNIAFLYIVRAA